MPLRLQVLWTLLLVTACGGTTPPAAEPIPIPAPEPAVVIPPAAAASTFAFVYRPGVFAVHAVSEAVSTVSLPGGAISDSLAMRSEARATLAATSESGALRIAGTLDSLVVTPARIAAAGSGYVRLLLPLPFSATMPVSGRGVLRVGSDSTGGCWSEARAVLDPLQGLFPAVPSLLREGMRWRDSVEVHTCRLGVPVLAREVRELVLQRIAGEAGTLVGYVAYTSTTSAAGMRTDRGARVVYAGRGEARGTLELDAILGVVRKDEREDRYRLSLSVDGAERVLTQRGRRALSLLPRN